MFVSEKRSELNYVQYVKEASGPLYINHQDRHELDKEEQAMLRREYKIKLILKPVWL